MQIILTSSCQKKLLWIFLLNLTMYCAEAKHMIVTVATTKELSFLRLLAQSSLPNALAGIQQVVSAKFLGVTFCQSLKLGDHVKNILTICGQHGYLLKCFKGQKPQPRNTMNITLLSMLSLSLAHCMPYQPPAVFFLRPI